MQSLTILGECLVSGALGILLHQIVKINGLRKRAKAGNEPFSIAKYLADDWLSIALSILSVLIFVWLLPEVTRYWAALANWIRFTYICVGYFGSSLILHIISKTEDKILSTIDRKTDIADGKIKATAEDVVGDGTRPGKGRP